MSKRARKAARKLDTAKVNARKSNAAALAAVPPKVLCKNLCGKSYMARSTAHLARHENVSVWVWGPDEETGVPVTTPEAPAVTAVTAVAAVAAVTGVEVLMVAAAEAEETPL